MIALLLTLRIASYALQASSGAPLVVAGRVDTAAVRALSRYDDVTLEATPWAMDVPGNARADVPLMLRQMNPRIRLWLYVLAGDQWLPPTFTVAYWDRSAFGYVFKAVSLTHGWLYGTDGEQWFQNYRVDLGNAATVDALAGIYCSLISTRLFDGIFLDDCHTSIAWTNNGQRQLDYRRAGYASIAAMDSARAANIDRLIARLHAAGGCGFLVALNGTGPKPKALDVDFREGLGSLVSVDEAMRWMETPGTHWLMADCWDGCSGMGSLLRGIGSHGDAIISAGPGRGPAVMP